MEIQTGARHGTLSDRTGSLRLGPDRAAKPGPARADEERLGEVNFPISCSPAAQQQFNRAVAMLHSFFFPETVKAFTAIAEKEPSCAMAYWGIAISQRPNPLVGPFPGDVLKRGWEAIEKARAASQKTEREIAWIEALAAFYQDYATVPQQTRTANYEAAMARLSARYPDDAEAAIFYALALNEAADPADKTYAKQLKAADILEKLEAKYPNHPGIPHYIIHSYDYPELAMRGVFAAARCARLAPSAPHALHMPSHIFSTLGMWQEVISSDRAADDATIAYTARVNPQAAADPAKNPARYHSLDFLTNAYLQLGQDQQAKRIVDARNSVRRISGGLPLQRAHGLCGHTRPLRVRARCLGGSCDARDSENAIRASRGDHLVRPRDRCCPQRRSDEGQGGDRSARRAQGQACQGERRILGRTGCHPGAGCRRPGSRSPRAAKADAIAAMRQAADLEDRSGKHVAMENRLSPIRELLGELLLEANEPAQALKEFETSLRNNPNRYRSFAGAAKAAERAGDRAQAKSYYEKLVALAARPMAHGPTLSRLSSILPRNNHRARLLAVVAYGDLLLIAS